jgi:hypothetical protein
MKTIFYLALVALVVTSCRKNDDDSSFTKPQEHLTGVPALSGQLERSKLTMTSAISVDLTRNIARFPLFRGTYRGATVWYVRTDVSDSMLARTLGLNFAPRLAKADNGCPACIQTVTSSNPIVGSASESLPALLTLALCVCLPLVQRVFLR